MSLGILSRIIFEPVIPLALSSSIVHSWNGLIGLSYFYYAGFTDSIEIADSVIDVMSNELSSSMIIGYLGACLLNCMFCSVLILGAVIVLLSTFFW